MGSPKTISTKQNHQLQIVIETLTQKIDCQTNVIASLQVSVDSMKGVVQQSSVAVSESIKEARTTYADIAKKGIGFNSTPRRTKNVQMPKTPKASKPTKPAIARQSNNGIGRLLSPVQREVARPNPEKAVWVSNMHRDTTVEDEELSDYISKATGLPPSDFDVLNLVKKDRDITSYRYWKPFR